MKTTSLVYACTLSFLVPATVFCQSTFQFQNLVPSAGIDAPVFDAQGNRLAGANYAAELWGGATSNSLSPTIEFDDRQRVILPFREGLAAGYFGTTDSMTVWQVFAGSFAWVQVRAWDMGLGGTYEEVVARSLGGYGESTVLYLRGGNPTGLPTLPAPLTGLQSFSLLPVVPEPSTWALLALGGVGVCLAVWRKRKRFR
jgi:hypothetical protein